MIFYPPRGKVLLRQSTIQFTGSTSALFNPKFLRPFSPGNTIYCEQNALVFWGERGTSQNSALTRGIKEQKGKLSMERRRLLCWEQICE